MNCASACAWVINKYEQPALVETFLPGREFTVGILGRPDAKACSRHPDWYDKDGFHRFPILELDSSRSVTPNVYSQAAKSKSVGEEGAPGYFCPAQVEPDFAKKLQHLAWRAHSLLGALDVSRTDIRLDEDGNPRLMEINTLPGLTPDYSDLMSAGEGRKHLVYRPDSGDPIPRRIAVGPPGPIVHRSVPHERHSPRHSP